MANRSRRLATEPLKEWTEVGVSAEFAAALHSVNLLHPWPTQVVPTESVLLHKKSIVLCPSHGVGTTTLLPLIAIEAANQALTERSNPSSPIHRDFISPLVLIIAPTQDLARHRFETIRDRIKDTNQSLSVRPFWGDRPCPGEDDRTFPDVHIVVGCAGRISQMLEKGTLLLVDVELSIWDEAPTLFGPEYGHADPDIRYIVSTMRNSRTNSRGVMVAPRLTLTLQAQLDTILSQCHAGATMSSQWPSDADPAMLKNIKFINIRKKPSMFKDEYAHDLRFRAFLGAAIAHDKWVSKQRRLPENIRTLSGSILVICSRRDTSERVKSVFANEIEDWAEPTGTVVNHGGMYEYERARSTAKFEEGLQGGIYTVFTTQHLGKKLACKPAVVCYDRPKFSKTNRLNNWLGMMARTGTGVNGNKGVFVTLLDPEDKSDQKLILQIVNYFDDLGRAVPMWMREVPPLAP